MEKTFTIIIPVRMDSDERRSNIETVLHWIAPLNVPVLLLEADTQSELGFYKEKFPKLEYIFVYDENKVFHRTKYINVLLRKAKTEIVAVWDADIIVSYPQIKETVDILAAGTNTIMYPYDGKIIMLPSDVSNGFRENMNLEVVERLSLSPLLGRRSCGGIYFVNKTLYFSIGGENENYIGWGPEDAERLRRTLIMGHRAEWLSAGSAYHLYHGTSSSNFWASALTKMRKEFIRECCMDREEMQQYINSEMPFRRA